MEQTSLRALSPVDGRYAGKVEALRDIFSEYGLIRYRVLVEIRWLQWLADEPDIGEVAPLSSVMKDMLNRIVDEFSTDDAKRVKKIEVTTNHDVKAVEYYIRDKIGRGADIGNIGDFIHFGCTSEDINNLAYGLMLRTARAEVLLPQMKNVLARLRTISTEYADLPMLSRTHGQIASPTTVGKEMKNVGPSATSMRRSQHIPMSTGRKLVNGSLSHWASTPTFSRRRSNHMTGPPSMLTRWFVSTRFFWTCVATSGATSRLDTSVSAAPETKWDRQRCPIK
jgi:adenylosuccinate lyase